MLGFFLLINNQISYFWGLKLAYYKNIENQGSRSWEKIKICLNSAFRWNELFLSVAVASVVFSDIFIVSLAFFGSFFGNAKKNIRNYLGQDCFSINFITRKMVSIQIL